MLEPVASRSPEPSIAKLARDDAIGVLNPDALRIGRAGNRPLDVLALRIVRPLGRQEGGA